MPTCGQAEDQGWGCLNGMLEQQLRWHCDTALRFEDGQDRSVVIVGNIPCCEQIAGYDKELDTLKQILKALKNQTCCDYGDFRGGKAEPVVYLCGHNHKDSHAPVNGVLHVSTGCDAYCKDDDLPRAVGTVNNTLFDLFLVDKDGKAVQVFRIGAGKDRYFLY